MPSFLPWGPLSSAPLACMQAWVPGLVTGVQAIPILSIHAGHQPWRMRVFPIQKGCRLSAACQQAADITAGIGFWA
jgi:hypothetical protein